MPIQSSVRCIYAICAKNVKLMRIRFFINVVVVIVSADIIIIVVFHSIFLMCSYLGFPCTLTCIHICTAILPHILNSLELSKEEKKQRRRKEENLRNRFICSPQFSHTSHHTRHSCEIPFFARKLV